MSSKLGYAIAILSLVTTLNSPASDIQFVDVTEHAGIHFEHAGGIDLRVVPALVGSGAAWRDYNNDGWLDLYIGNYIEYTKVPQGDEVFFPYDFFGQANLLYLNKGDGGFINITDAAKVNGGFHLTLGVAAADYDADGDLDLFIVNSGGKPMLLRNDGENRQNWLQIRTVGTVSNRDGVGALVKVSAGDLHQIQQVTAGDSYLSQSSLDVEFGLAHHEKVNQIVIQWPSGIVQTLIDVEVNQRLIVVESAK